MGQRVDQIRTVRADRTCARQDRAVAMLHAVAVRPRQVVGDERVGVAFERRIFSVNLAGFPDDALGVGSEGVELCIRAGVVDDEADAGCTWSVGNREGTKAERTELRRTVHEVLQVGRREGERRVAGEELCTNAPVGARRRLEAKRRGPHFKAARPHQCGRHVDVRMGAVDPEVGAVHAVAEDAVGHSHGTGMACDSPLVWTRLGCRQRHPGFVGDAHVEHVLDELVQRVPPG